MPNTTSLQRLISIRDKLLDAVEKLAGEGVSSYTIGDQTYTFNDLDDLMGRVDKLDKQIAVKTRTAGGVKGYNRMDLRRYRP